MCRWIVLLITLAASVLCSPMYANYGTDHNVYHGWLKERLQHLGLYPRVFRYGTGSQPLPSDYQHHWYNHFMAQPRTRSNPWWTTYNNHPSRRMGGWQWPSPSQQYDDEYDDLLQRQLQQIEQDTLEVVWN